MPSIPLQRTLAISSLVYAATLWGLVWYPYRLLDQAGMGGIASAFFSYAIPLLLLGWLHGRALHSARGHWRRAARWRCCGSPATGRCRRAAPSGWGGRPG